MARTRSRVPFLTCDSAQPLQFCATLGHCACISSSGNTCHSYSHAGLALQGGLEHAGPVNGKGSVVGKFAGRHFDHVSSSSPGSWKHHCIINPTPPTTLATSQHLLVPLGAYGNRCLTPLRYPRRNLDSRILRTRSTYHPVQRISAASEPRNYEFPIPSSTNPPSHFSLTNTIRNKRQGWLLPTHHAQQSPDRPPRQRRLRRHYRRIPRRRTIR
jgi:hypothetical protein